MARLTENNWLRWPVVLLTLVVVVDQLTKLWAVDHLTGEPSMEIIGRLIMFTLVYNEGGALGTNLGSSAYYLISSSIILIAVLYYIYANRHLPKLSLPLSLIAGGAIGNIIDRIRQGRVIDFIDVDFPDIDILGYQLQRWWTFNVADAAISTSIVFILIGSIFFHHQLMGCPPQECSEHEESRSPDKTST